MTNRDKQGDKANSWPGREDGPELLGKCGTEEVGRLLGMQQGWWWPWGCTKPPRGSAPLSMGWCHPQDTCVTSTGGSPQPGRTKGWRRALRPLLAAASLLLPGLSKASPSVPREPPPCLAVPPRTQRCRSRGVSSGSGRSLRQPRQLPPQRCRAGAA